MQVNDDMVRAAVEAAKDTMHALPDVTEETYDEKLGVVVRAALNAALAHMWRPVSQPADLPQDGMYIAANDHKQVAVIEARDGHRLVQNMPGFVDWAPVCNITAYMPLPAPPKTGGE